MKGCLLCLEIQQDLVGSIQVNSSQWQELGIQHLIEKHFWPMDELQTSCSWLCTECWQELYDFHKFYIRIEEAHAELGLSMKEINSKCPKNDEIHNDEDLKPPTEIVIFHESHFEPEISIKEALNTVTSVEEDKIVIKEEVENEEQNENTTVTRNKRSPRQRLPNDKNGSIIQKDPLSLRKHDKESNSKKSKNNKAKDLKEKADTVVNSTTSVEKTELVEVKQDPEPLKMSENESDSDGTDTDSNYEPEKDLCSPNKKKGGSKKKKTNHENDKFIAENFKIICSLCQIQAETFHALCKHFKAEHKQAGYVICCKKKFYRHSILVDHVHQHVDPNYFKCTICDKVMADRKCLNMHNKTHKDKKEKTHTCEICFKKFSMYLSLKLHKMSHLSEDEKHESCTECDKKFASKSLLSYHVRSVHLKKNMYICDKCGKSIRCKEVFERHMLQHEVEPLPTVSCNICGMLLANKHRLKKHKLMVHPVGGKKEFTCPVCAKISFNFKAHKKHIQYSHMVHKCTMCDKAFQTAHTLKKHMASHSGAIIYSCSWCPKTFNSNANFQSHRKKAHPQECEDVTRKKYSGDLLPNYSPTANNTNDCELPLYTQTSFYTINSFAKNDS